MSGHTPVPQSAPGREVVPVAVPAALPVAVRAGAAPRPPRDPRQEPPWTSVPSVEPSSVDTSMNP